MHPPAIGKAKPREVNVSGFVGRPWTSGPCCCSPLKKKGRRRATFAKAVIGKEGSKKSGEKSANPTGTAAGGSKKKSGKKGAKPVEATEGRGTKKLEVEKGLKTAMKKDPPPHSHTHPRSIVEACIQVSGNGPKRKFVETLQDFLQNAQIVDKHFGFAPVKENRGKLIFGAGKISLNMTVLGAYFKISSQGGRNPFKRQKVWGKNKTKKGDEFKDPTVYFTMAVATDEDPAEVMDRVRQEWGRIGGKMLRVKELQSFDSKTIISLFNISTQVPKKIILEEFRAILVAAPGGGE
jgi:hypothetical protein